MEIIRMRLWNGKQNGKNSESCAWDDKLMRDGVSYCNPLSVWGGDKSHQYDWVDDDYFYTNYESRGFNDESIIGLKLLTN